MKALIILAPGFEEIEAITVIDVLRRAEMEVVVAGIAPNPIVASRKTKHLADVALEKVRDQSFDLIILPGGNEGTVNLKKDPFVREILAKQKKRDGWIAAICAAPTLLYEQGLLDPSQKIICHPSMQKTIPSEKLESGKRVIISGKLITSLGAGSAMEFAYAIVETLLGREKVASVNQGVCAAI